METKYVYLTAAGSIVTLCCYLGFKWWKSLNTSRNCAASQSPRYVDLGGISIDNGCTSWEFIDTVGTEEGHNVGESQWDDNKCEGKQTDDLINYFDDLESSESRGTRVCLSITPSEGSWSSAGIEDSSGEIQGEGESLSDGTFSEGSYSPTEYSLGAFKSLGFHDTTSGYCSDMRDNRINPSRSCSLASRAMYHWTARDREIALREWTPYESDQLDQSDESDTEQLMKMMPKPENTASSRRRVYNYKPTTVRLRESYAIRDRKNSHDWIPYSPSKRRFSSLTPRVRRQQKHRRSLRRYFSVRHRSSKH